MKATLRLDARFDASSSYPVPAWLGEQFAAKRCVVG